MPQTQTVRQDITVGQDLRVDIELSLPELSTPANEATPVLRPQESTAIEVSIKACGSQNDNETCALKADEAVEFTVMAIDKAILELVPHGLRDVAADYVFNLGLSFDVASSSDILHAPGAITGLVEKFVREQEENPWASIDSELLTPGSGYFGYYDDVYDSYDYFDDELAEFGTGAVAFAVASGGAAAESATVAKSVARTAPAPPPFAPAPSADAEVESAGASGGAGAALRSQADFMATPLFVTVNATDNGSGAVNFTAPDNLGTFVVRAYAATDKARFGSVETEVIVRRKLSLTPSAPRIVRVGDAFEAGVIVTISGGSVSDVPITMDLKLEDKSQELLSLTTESERQIVTDADGQAEVRFGLQAEALGEAKFIISAGDGSGSGDALELELPILGLQDPVTVATSFAIQAAENETATAVEGLDLPAALPGTGGIELQAGVGRLPAVLANARQIMEANVNHTCPHDGSLELVHTVVPAALQMYSLYTPDEDEEQDRATEALLATSGANFSLALQNLAVDNLTHSEFGLRWWIACPPLRPRMGPLRSASIYLNAHAVWLLDSLQDLLESTDQQVFLEGAGALRKLSDEHWRPALATQLVRDAQESRSRRFFPGPIRLSTVALARLGLGRDWAPPEGTEPQIVDDISMERLDREFGKLDMESRAYVALIHLRNQSEAGDELVARAIDEWTSNFRVGGRTAYIATCNGCATPMGLKGNALVLLTMTRAGQAVGPFREKLANYVASPPAGRYAYFADYIEKIVAMLALGEYDLARGSADPDLGLVVTSGDVELLQAEFTSPQSPMVVTGTSWSVLNQPPAPLEFSVDGKGEVTIAALLNFVPAEPLPFPTYRGIYVEQAIQLVNGSSQFDEPMGAPLSTVPLGSIVIVTIQITTPDALDATTVRILMPGGLEPVDPNIEGDSFGVCALPFFGVFSSFPYFNCPDQETLPSVVTFRYNRLRAGTHVMRVRAVAATPGVFGLPPTAAFVNSQPELMGLSPAGSFEVCDGEGCEAVPLGPARTPKACPQDCNNNGLCDLDKGTCLCFEGFTGDACGAFVET
ncbi:unnamed protein product [Ostreobium quekettii]|uniref:EGF-like domain-containing protein n=1 Tax=Ostreobium quekettii TaxID=121088 RepID=A0A8S1IZF3_9CHLO|nr:unnamed protein product [Ostreobium quekettii]